MCKMAAFISCGSCGPRVLFLVLEQQTKVLRFQPAAFTFAATQKVEAKAIEFASNERQGILGELSLGRETNFWLEILLRGNFVKDRWKENLRTFRRELYGCCSAEPNGEIVDEELIQRITGNCNKKEIVISNTMMSTLLLSCSSLNTAKKCSQKVFAELIHFV